jgi:hypothetical protein
MTQSTLLNEPDAEEQSLTETLTELAHDLHLPELHWEFLHAHDDVIVQGHPQAPTDIAACPRWAQFLKMCAVGSESEVNGTRWLGSNGPWTLEIIAEVEEPWVIEPKS